MKSTRGFTLIEVLITIAILAVLAILSNQTIQRSFAAKAKIQDQIDDLSRVRDALRLMERDIALAYHHRDFEKEILDALKAPPPNPSPAPGIPGAPPGTPSPTGTVLTPDPPREAPRQDPVTHFVSSAEEMNFVTLNVARIQVNSRDPDLIEVGYSLKDCRDKAGGKCLWRRTSNVVDSDVTRGGNELVLLEHVEELKFRYIGRGKTDWVSEWRTDNGGDAITKNNYPWAVEISLTFKKGEGEKLKKYSMQVIAPVHFPNNKEEEGKNANPNAAPAASGTTGTPPPH